MRKQEAAKVVAQVTRLATVLAWLAAMLVVHARAAAPLPVRAADAGKLVPVPIAVPGGEDPARLAEIRVELAWLADPVTFPYELQAKMTPGGLEIRGHVTDP